ncbi:cyclophilin-like domain-containing protein [Sporodiniella umbellata]|nr:cyclophilin-like domain-containing protein [Sporodiniella umbellata]
MSNIYALEPHTDGKVILHTTSGDIEIELWGKEAPRATRNFIQLCLEGYYDNTIFHRIVPDFLVQGGDPTGTGQGGESIYEDGFANEFHSRLRFNRRGLVGVANTGQDDNGSQFFITLDRADELTRRHTLFGRVAGETLFNVMKMTELELDANERPKYPPKIKRTEVVMNPFDDILPRITEREKQHAKEIEEKRKAAEAAKKKKPAKKQLNLLSFGEEAAEAEIEIEKETVFKKKSAYDYLENSAPASETLQEELDKPSAIAIKLEEMKAKEKQRDEERRKRIQEEKEKKKKALEEQEKMRQNVVIPETRQDAIEKMKQDIRSLSKPVSEPEPVAKKEKKRSLVALEREKYASQKKKKAKKGDDSDVFKKLLSFQKKLSSAQELEEAPKKELTACKIHDIPGCESCRDTTIDVEEEVDDSGWIAHRLVFDKDLKGKDLMKRKDALDDYVVIDPRSREAQAKQEEYEQHKTSSRRRDEIRSRREPEERDSRKRYRESSRYDDRRDYEHSSRRRSRSRDRKR